MPALRLLAVAAATAVLSPTLAAAPTHAAPAPEKYERKVAKHLKQGASQLRTGSAPARCMDALLARRTTSVTPRMLERRCAMGDARLAIGVTGAKPRRAAQRVRAQLGAAVLQQADHLAVEAKRGPDGGWGLIVAIARTPQAQEPQQSEQPVLGNPQPGDPEPENSQVAAGIIGATNAARGIEGLPALRRDACLTASAERHARALAARGSLFHQEMPAVAAECGLKAVGENVLYNHDGGAKYAVDQWLDSPGHRANILRSSYTRIGVAQLYDASTKRYFAVQVFGS